MAAEIDADDGRAGSVMLRYRVGIGLVAVCAGASVYSLLGSHPPSPGRIDFVFRRFHLSWETAVAVLWPLFVVRPRLVNRRIGTKPGAAGTAPVRSELLAGWLGLLGGIGLGSVGGVLASALVRGIPELGDPAVPLAMALTLTTLYLLASALALATEHPGRWLLGVYLVPNGLAPLLKPMSGWPPLDAFWTWVSVGRLGPGTLLEVPALVGGLVLEPEWHGIDPWETLGFWLLIAFGVLGATLRLSPHIRTPLPAVER